MAMKVVIENDCATLWYDPDKKIVAHKIRKFFFGEPFYQLLLTGTELMRKNKAHKWLSDDSQMPVLSQEDTDWGRVNWFPQTVKAGWKYWAIVKPVQVIGEMSINRLVAEYSKAGITARIFTDYDEALKWLESQPD